MITVTIPREILEADVERRLQTHNDGKPGLSHGTVTGDGTRELVMRDSRGTPIGVMGFNAREVTDFAVARPFRRLGIASAMYENLRLRGIVAIRGPFTEDGLAFVTALKGGV